MASPQFQRMHETDPTTPSSAFQLATQALTRKQTGLLMQLCMGHIPLQHYLYHINKAESPLCPLCLTKNETVYHYML